MKNRREFLQLYLTTSDSQRKALLNSISKEHLKVLSEIVHNIVKGTVILNVEQKQNLRKYKTLLLVLGERKTTALRKKKALLRGRIAVLFVLRAIEKTLRFIWK